MHLNKCSLVLWICLPQGVALIRGVALEEYVLSSGWKHVSLDVGFCDPPPSCLRIVYCWFPLDKNVEISDPLALCLPYCCASCQDDTRMSPWTYKPAINNVIQKQYFYILIPAAGSWFHALYPNVLLTGMKDILSTFIFWYTLLNWTFGPLPNFHDIDPPSTNNPDSLLTKFYIQSLLPWTQNAAQLVWALGHICWDFSHGDHVSLSSDSSQAWHLVSYISPGMANLCFFLIHSQAQES